MPENKALEAMIAKAEESLGLAGRPNYITEWYAGRNGAYYKKAPWCQMSITYWAFHSGNYNEVCHGIDFAYTVWAAQRYRSHMEWYPDVAGIRRGDIVYFDWSGTNNIENIDHVGIVTGVDGPNIFTIEGNTADSCKRRVRTAATIAGYGRPVYKKNKPKPPPKPTPKPYVPPPFPPLAPNTEHPETRALQLALMAAGYMSQSVTLSDNYGPLTQAAVIRFHDRNPQYATRPGDPAIGPQGWAELHREAYA